MNHFVIMMPLLLLLVVVLISANSLPIVFVYYLVPESCDNGIPEYVRVTLHQSVSSQPDANVYFLSNFGDCNQTKQRPFLIEKVAIIDSTKIMSSRSMEFQQKCLQVFPREPGELWTTAAVRFLLLEDFMRLKGFDELLHVETDNMLYGNITSIVPSLRQHYNRLAVTPLAKSKLFLTASVLWVASLDALTVFNIALMRFVDSNTTFSQDVLSWVNYTDWLRLHPGACCKMGGVQPDVDGMGIKPFAINEMSLLAYYHYEFPQELRLLPVLPVYAYPDIPDRNMTAFSPGGHEVGPGTGHSIWDSGSWGQYIGGTLKKHGRNKKFTDPSHVVGYAIRSTDHQCTAEMRCDTASHSALTTITNNSCFTAAFVRCGENSTWSQLLNLHVHSKITSDFVSVPCKCIDDGVNL